MFRPTFMRHHIINNGLRKFIQSNIRRCLCTELSLRKFSKVILYAQSRRILVKSQWNIQKRYYSLPSHTKVTLPALSPTMETGSIVKWAKKEGDELNEGDLLCEIETDKAVMGFDSPDSGFLAKIMLPAGTKGVPIGKLLCIIVQEKAHIAAFKDFKDTGVVAAAPALAATPASATAPAAAAAPAVGAAPAGAPSGDRVYASPMARRLAAIGKQRLSGVPAAAAAPAEARTAAPAAPAAPAKVTVPAGARYVDIPVTSMRGIIAKRLLESKLTIPHYQLVVTVNVDKVLKMRARINKKLAAEKRKEKISVNDFIVKATAAACVRVPAANTYWMETSIRQFSQVDVCVAVATPTGLLTPILFNADSRGMIDLSKTMKDLAKRAREGTLKPHEFQGGTVTISNLGMFGVTMFNAIVNPPQTLILACGGLQDVVIPDKKKGFKTAKFITFTSSANHKAIDGAECAMWMKALKENLEDPANMIL